MLPSNATVNEVVHLLDDPTAFIQGILENFVVYGYDPHSSVVRIGVSGFGSAPNYKIENQPHHDTYPIPNEQGGSTTVTLTAIPNHTFRGGNHSEMIELNDMCYGDKWSTATMTHRELQVLLGRVQTVPPAHM